MLYKFKSIRKTKKIHNNWNKTYNEKLNLEEMTWYKTLLRVSIVIMN